MLNVISFDGHGRPTRKSLHMQTALMWAERSLDPRLRVGAIITSLDLRRVISIGYNGPAKGLPHDYPRDEPGNSGCLHAEDNAVSSMAQSGIQMWGAKTTMFVTHSPCEMCAQRIINAGIVHVLYTHKYKQFKLVNELLPQCGVSLTRIHPAFPPDDKEVE